MWCQTRLRVIGRVHHEELGILLTAQSYEEWRRRPCVVLRFLPKSEKSSLGSLPPAVRVGRSGDCSTETTLWCHVKSPATVAARCIGRSPPSGGRTKAGHARNPDCWRRTRRCTTR